MDKKYCNKNILPLSLCNFTNLENINRDIFKRNFPSNKMPISYDFRSNYNLCKGGINNENVVDDQLQVTHIVNREGLDNLQNNFNPGKGAYYGYAQSVNTESNLRNINIKNSLCPEYKYQLDAKCLSCNCDKNLGFCHKKMNNNNYQSQLLNKNMPACDQGYVDVDSNIKYTPYPSSNVTDVGIINPVYNKSTLIKNNIDIENDSNHNSIVNIEKKNINLCNQNQPLPICKNNNYMKGYFIGSAITDIKAKENGFNGTNNGVNKWEKYKDVLNEQQMIDYDVIKNDFNTLPFGLGRYGVPHNDYLKNDQQCQNLYNNMTKVKCLYGKPN